MKSLAFAVLAGALGMAAPVGAAEPPITSVNLASIKAIFDRHDIPAEIGNNQNGSSYVSATVNGYLIIASPADCGSDDQTGACGSVQLLSTAWMVPATGDQLQEYMKTVPGYPSALSVIDGKAAMLRYSFDVAGGVGDSYVEQAMVEFLNSAKNFEGFLKQIASGSASPGTGFSSSRDLTLPIPTQVDLSLLSLKSGGHAGLTLAN